MISTALVLSIVCLAVQASPVSVEEDYFTKYEGHSVFLIHPKIEHHVTELKKLHQEQKLFNFWNDVRGVGHPVNIMVDAPHKPLLEAVLKTLGVEFSVVIENVADAMKAQHDYKPYQKLEKLSDFDYGKYHTWQEVYDWIDQLEQEYPSYVSIFNVTRSYEGRYLKAFKISVPSNDNSVKKAMWFDGGIHAREWISPATVIYIAYSLLSKYGSDPDVTQILNTFDFYILPVFNVDGYNYTFAKDRMWRKTRSKTRVPTCMGADPNRNWDSHFCDAGASKDPCDDTYCGAKAFSEIEVKGVADFLSNNNATIICYINFHSYSQLWMTPWGYSTKQPSDFTIQDNGSIAAVNALKTRYGTSFDHGNIASTIYVASGGSVDWTYDTAKILYSYAVELRDQGQYGFLLPEDQIIPSGLETFDAVKALIFYIKGQL